MLVAPFSSPRRVRVETVGGRRRLVFGDSRVDATTYALIVVDEAHHLVGDSSLHSELAELGAAESSLLFLGDASQATAAMSRPDAIARSLVTLPLFSRVVVATLSEVVRSTKRIVAGAAAYRTAANKDTDWSRLAAHEWDVSGAPAQLMPRGAAAASMPVGRGPGGETGRRRPSGARGAGWPRAPRSSRCLQVEGNLRNKINDKYSLEFKSS